MILQRTYGTDVLIIYNDFVICLTHASMANINSFVNDDDDDHSVPLYDTASQKIEEKHFIRQFFQGCFQYTFCINSNKNYIS